MPWSRCWWVMPMSHLLKISPIPGATLRSRKPEQCGGTAVSSYCKVCAVWDYTIFDKSKISTEIIIRLIPGWPHKCVKESEFVFPNC